MNTLPSVITAGTLLQYADDTTLICTSSGSNAVSTAAVMTCHLQLVHSWIVDSKIVRSFVLCGFDFAFVDALWSSLIRIVVNKVILQPNVKQKYLGLIFDN